jgi:hypothetical protein
LLAQDGQYISQSARFIVQFTAGYFCFTCRSARFLEQPQRLVGVAYYHAEYAEIGGIGDGDCPNVDLSVRYYIKDVFQRALLVFNKN